MALCICQNVLAVQARQGATSASVPKAGQALRSSETARPAIYDKSLVTGLRAPMDQNLRSFSFCEGGKSSPEAVSASSSVARTRSMRARSRALTITILVAAILVAAI